MRHLSPLPACLLALLTACAGADSATDDSDAPSASCVSFASDDLGTFTATAEPPTGPGLLRLDNTCASAVTFERVASDSALLSLPSSITVPPGGTEVPVELGFGGGSGDSWDARVDLYRAAQDSEPALQRELYWYVVAHTLYPPSIPELIAPVGCPQRYAMRFSWSDPAEPIVEDVAWIDRPEDATFELEFEGLPITVTMPQGTLELPVRVDALEVGSASGELRFDGRVYEAVVAPFTARGIPADGRFVEEVDNDGEAPIHVVIDTLVPVDRASMRVTLDGAAWSDWTLDDTALTVRVPPGRHQVQADYAYICED